jgi:hypothetical protein
VKRVRFATAALCAAAMLASRVYAEDAPPPRPQDPEWLQYAVLGGLFVAGAALLVGSVIAAGDEDHRKTYAAPYDYLMAVVSPLGGAGFISIASGFAALGTYNLLNHHSSGTRIAVNGVGVALSFAAALVERRIELGEWKSRRMYLVTGPSEMRVAMRF